MVEDDSVVEDDGDGGRVRAGQSVLQRVSKISQTHLFGYILC